MKSSITLICTAKKSIFFFRSSCIFKPDLLRIYQLLFQCNIKRVPKGLGPVQIDKVNTDEYKQRGASYVWNVIDSQRG